MLDTPIDFARLFEAVYEQRSIDDKSVHGVAHWKQVEYNGLFLADVNGADVDVIRLFAIFHDSRRVSDGYDESHGALGAELARQWRGKYYEIDDERFEQLYRACKEHTTTHFTGDITIDTCFDADRLDLARVEIIPDPEKMATAAGTKIAALGRKMGISCLEYREWIRKLVW